MHIQKEQILKTMLLLDAVRENVLGNLLLNNVNNKGLLFSFDRQTNTFMEINC